MTRGASAGTPSGSTRPRATTGFRACAFPAKRTAFPTTHEMADYLEAYASALRASGALGNDRGDAVEGGRPVRGHRRRARRSRQTTSSSRRASCRSRTSRASHRSSIRASGSSTRATTATSPSCRTGARARRRSEPLRSRHRLRGGGGARHHPVGAGHRADPGIGRDAARTHRLPRAVLPRVRTSSRWTRRSAARCARTSATAALRSCATGRRTCSPRVSSGRSRDTVGVQDGMPVLDDGRVVDVQNVIWCTGFRRDFSWIRGPVRGRRRRLPGAVPRRRRLSSRPLLRGAALPALVHVDAHRRGGQGRRAGRQAHCGSARERRGVCHLCRSDRRPGRLVSERLPQRPVANGHERADATPILVWNGLVTRLRRTGAERRTTRLAWPPVRSSEDESANARRIWKDVYESLTPIESSRRGIGHPRRTWRSDYRRVSAADQLGCPIPKRLELSPSSVRRSLHAAGSPYGSPV